MIDTVHLGNPTAPVFVMKMEAVYSSESVVSVDTVSKPDSLGVYLHPALKQAMFRAGHAYCGGSLLYSMTPADLSGAMLICVGCCVCISRIGNPGNSAGCHLFIHSTAVCRGCIPLATALWWESVSIFSFCIPILPLSALYSIMSRVRLTTGTIFFYNPSCSLCPGCASTDNAF